MKKTSSLLILFSLTFIQPTFLAAQDTSTRRQHGTRSLTLIRTEGEIILDGRLDEEDWERAERITGFVQKDPDQGMPATEPTEVRALYDSENLYFGIQCFDSQAEGIRATELRRDDRFQNDDSFGIILDTFHDHRNAFLFRINPRGTQYDALVTDEGRDINSSWDEIWEVQARIDETGWSAEIRIPLSSIRFSASDGPMVFGVDFERVIRRKNESSYWNNFSRDYTFEQVSQSGHLYGISDIESALRLRVKPYIGARILTRGADDRPTNFLGDFGLEDLKYAVTSGLTLDLTLNTDFAQTEVDDQIINFDRFPVFFPEKREFFLEGAGIFEFGIFRGEGRPQIKLYHSRRIGLSDQGAEIPMLGGVKLTGKLGEKFTLGFLEAQTDKFGARPGDNFAVFRLKRDILARSNLGFFFTNRQAKDGDYNRVIGFDQNLTLLEHLQLTGLIGSSFTDGIDEDQMIGIGAISWKDDLIDAGFSYTHLQENFDSDLGFIERKGTRKIESRFAYTPRPESDIIRRFNFSYRLENFQRVATNELETRFHHFNYSIFFENGSWIRLAPHHETENLIEPLRLPGNLTVPEGRYSWWYIPVTYSLNPARMLSGQIGYRYEKDYYGKGGRRHNWTINPTLKLSSRVSADLRYNLNQIGLFGGELESFHQVNSGVNVAFSRKWLTSTRIQYNSSSDVIGYSIRLNYIYRPGDDLFIVLNDFRDQTNDPSNMDRSFAIKLTHSFDF
ncbi:MAG: carbohydrate binding family 9 domain-containing protein [Acidobacteria bacterium]|nr:carbohydrate binding family 9 domain-containing protein [Acidobacteriota bacterium]